MDQARLDALKQGIAAAMTESHVVIAVRDLQWLLEQVDQTRNEAPKEGEESDAG